MHANCMHNKAHAPIDSVFAVGRKVWFGGYSAATILNTMGIIVKAAYSGDGGSSGKGLEKTRVIF